MSESIIKQIADGRTDLVFDYLAAGHPATSADKDGTSLIKFTDRSVETSGFMRDCRTKGETPLHRAAAFGTEETIQILLDAGANIEAKDMNGDSPLSWASWYARPDSILRMLCYGDFHIRPDRRSMAAYLLGERHV